MCTAITTFAQVQNEASNFKIEVSEAFEFKVANKTWLENSSEYILAVNQNSRGHILIQSFDIVGLNGVASSVSEVLRKNMTVEYVVELDDNFYIFYYGIDKEAGGLGLYMREINPKSAQMSDVERRLLSLPDTKSRLGSEYFLSHIGEYKSLGIGDLRFEKSNNSEYLMLRYTCEGKRIKGQSPVHLQKLFVFDNEMELMSHGEVEFENLSLGTMFMDYQLAQDGTMNILTRVANDPENIDPRAVIVGPTADYHFELLQLAPEEELFETFSFEIDSKLPIKSATLTEDLEGNISIIGLYCPGYMIEIGGVFILRLDQFKNEIVQEYVEIPKDFWYAYLNEKDRNNLDKGNAEGQGGYDIGLNLKSISFDNSGNVLISGEEIANYDGITSNSAHLFALEIDAEGDLLWMNKIPKRQNPEGSEKMNWIRGEMSYTMLRDSESAHFLFLNQLSNLNIDKNTCPTFVDAKVRKIGDNQMVLQSASVDMSTNRRIDNVVLELNSSKGTSISRLSVLNALKRSNDEVIFLACDEPCLKFYWVKVALN